MIEVRLPQSGGCTCGQVRFRLTALPYTVYLCHCSICRRQSGAAYGISMSAPRDAFEVTAGEPAVWRKPNSAGGLTSILFCATCSSRLCSLRDGASHVTLRPGVLDNPSWVKPVGQMWTGAALPWALLDGVLSYEGNPDSYQPMLDAWRALDVRPA